MSCSKYSKYKLKMYEFVNLLSTSKGLDKSIEISIGTVANRTIMSPDTQKGALRAILIKMFIFLFAECILFGDKLVKM